MFSVFDPCLLASRNKARQAAGNTLRSDPAVAHLRVLAATFLCLYRNVEIVNSPAAVRSARSRRRQHDAPPSGGELCSTVRCVLRRAGPRTGSACAAIAATTTYGRLPPAFATASVDIARGSHVWVYTPAAAMLQCRSATSYRGTCGGSGSFSVRPFAAVECTRGAVSAKCVTKAFSRYRRRTCPSVPERSRNIGPTSPEVERRRMEVVLLEAKRSMKCL